MRSKAGLADWSAEPFAGRVFTSVKDLRDAIRSFVKQHNKSSAKPFIWTKSATVILEKIGKVSKLKDHTNQTGH